MPEIENVADKRKKTINLSIQKSIVEKAKDLELNLSRHAEKGIRDAIKKKQSEKWLKENRAAIKAHNKRVAKEGLLVQSYWTE